MKKEKKHRIKFTPGRIFAFVLAVVVLCCMMMSVLEARNGWAWDITAGDIYTLSDETLDVLENVDDTINIYTLYSLGNYNKTILTLLEKYQFYCKNIIVSNIDPMGDRLAIKELGVEDNLINEGALIVMSENMGRSRVIDVDELYMTYDTATYFLAENRITDAINYVITGDYRRILLTVGHRETASQDLDKFVKRMTMQNYIVEEYDYLHTATVPDPETDIIISVSPKEDFTETETEGIRNFVDGGGTYILLYDYAEYDAESGAIAYTEADIPKLQALIGSLGIKIGSGIVVGKDAAETGFRNTVVELSSADGNESSAVFSESTYLKEKNSDYTVTPLLVTSENCELQFREGELNIVSEKPPYTTVMLAEKIGRVAVFASSSFIGDTELAVAGNEELIDGVLKKSAAGYPLSVVAPRRVATDELNINSMLIKVALTVLVVILLPCGILAAGIVTVNRRKRAAGEREETE